MMRKAQSNSTILTEKAAQLDSLMRDSENAVSVITTTIDRLANVNERINSTRQEIESYKAELERLDGSMEQQFSHNAKIIAKFATYCVNNLPDYFFTVPASSSGKYHPSYALGDGGLVRHTKAAVSIAHELFNLEMFPFTNEEQDLIIVSLILHDGLKQGDGNGKRTWNTSKYSKVELPKPKNKFQKYVHLCDYLASRKYLEFNFEAI